MGSICFFVEQGLRPRCGLTPAFHLFARLAGSKFGENSPAGMDAKYPGCGYATGICRTVLMKTKDTRA